MTVHRLIGQIAGERGVSAGALGDIRVEALDAEGRIPDLLAFAITDQRGKFSMVIDTDHLEQLLGDRQPSITFRLLRNLEERVLLLRANYVLWKPLTDESTIRIQLVSGSSSDAPSDSLVRGTVRTPAGAAVTDVSVKAYDKKLVDEDDVLLGSDLTIGDEGQFTISYDRWSSEAGWLPAPNLVVRAFRGATIVAEIGPVYNAPPTIDVELIDGASDFVGPSEHATASARTAPVIPSGFELKSATTAHVKHLSAATDTSPDHVSALAAAASLNDATPDVGSEFFYGLVRQGLPADGGQLLLTSPAGLREALRSARAQNTIAKSTADTAITAALGELRAKLIDNTFSSSGTPVGGVLRTVLSETDARSFLDAYLSHEGPLDVFWSSSAITTAYPVDDVQFTLQAGLLSRFHEPLVTELQARRAASSDLQTLQDFASYTEQDWHDLLAAGSGVVGYPSDMHGDDSTAKTANYAAFLRRTMETLFPTPSIAGDVSRATDAASLNLTANFFPIHKTFEFGKHRVDEFFATGSVSGVSTEGKALLKHMERLFRLTPRHAEMQVLLADGLHSAREVLRVGHEAFVARYGAVDKLGSAAIAEEVWANACRTAAHALALHATYGAAMNQGGAAALPDLRTRATSADPAQDANWSLLFGSPDFCRCDECASVYGAPAYLVDLLDFLGHSSATLGGETVTARDVLLDRRPDLARIELSCANTVTPLPYVDLVNEILEYAVVGKETGTQPAFPSHIKTDGDAQTLLALPQVQDNDDDSSTQTPHDQAYGILQQKVHPWSLPFDLGASEARVYLDHLGAPRAGLMRALQRASGTPVTYAPSNEAIAAESLGLSPGERLIITGADFPPSPATPASIKALWGLAEGASMSTLKSVPTFLAKSGWSFDELVELLDTATLRRFCLESGPSLSSPSGSECDTDAMTIAGLDPEKEAAAWQILHRFGRLQRRLGYSVREMDQMVTAFDTTIDDAFLVSLATAGRLRARFGVPVPVIASWFGDLDVQRRDQGNTPSFYEQVFQNKSVTPILDAGLSLESIASSTDLITAHADAITSALRITAYELALLTQSSVSTAQLPSGPAVLESKQISLGNLSILHRIVTFARALGLTIFEFLILDDLSGKPFTTYDPEASGFDPAAVEAFVKTIELVRKSGLKIAELRYLFENIQSAGPSSNEPDAIDTTLQALYADQLAIYRRQIVAVDPTGEQLRSLLQTVVGDPDTVNAIMTFVESGETPGSPAMDPDDFFDEFASLMWDSATVRSGLIGTSALAEPAARFSLVYSHMSISIQCANTTHQALAAAVKLDASTALTLLGDMLTGSAGGPLVFAFALPVLDPMPDTVPVPSTARDDYRHLEKAAMIVRRLGLGSKEVGACRRTDSTVSPAAKLFDFDALPRGTDPVAASSTLFAALQTLIDVVSMRGSMSGRGEGLASCLESGADSAVSVIAGILSWPMSDLQALTDATTGLNLTFGGPVSNARSLLRLRDAVGAVHRLGVSAATALTWAGTMTLAKSAAIVQAAKAKHSDAAWVDVARPLRDVLREKQRRALVDYLVAKAGYRDSDDLFGQMLVDVEMAPIQLTSRIKQAIGSVQTFIQRSFLNLEPGVSLGDEAAREWEWRKSYRVWEANRQIFLYPENWILPELRDDKSPFFQELEQALRQKDITDEVAEKAFADYLQKLERVAHLEVMAAFHQEEPGDLDHDPIDVLHVVARTRQDPQQLYYRTRGDGTRWTPWQLVDIDVQANELLLAVIDRRLHLFWPSIEKKADKKDSPISQKDQGKPPSYHLEIKLGWSEYQGGKWSAPRLTSDDPIILGVHPDIRRKWISFALQQINSVYVINCFLTPTAWTGTAELPVAVGCFTFDVCKGEMLTVSYDVSAHYTKGRFETERTVKYYRNKAPIPPPERVYLTMPYEMTPTFQDAAFPPSGGSGELKILIMENGVQQPAVILGQVGSPRLLSAHEVTETGAGLVDQDQTIDWFFLKDSGKCFFAEPATITTKTHWGLPQQAHPSFAPVIRANDVRVSAGVRSWAQAAPEAVKFAKTTVSEGYRFHLFYHPYACDFLAELRRAGVSGLLRWPLNQPTQSLQFRRETGTVTKFASTYQPSSSAVAKPYPIEGVDFSWGGAYSLYNWEVFFHIPFLIAVRLMENQRFEEAQKWFHHIFDPTAGASAGKAPQRYWKVKPFHQNNDLATIQEELAALADDSEASVNPGSALAKNMLELADTAERFDLDAQISAWEKDPFNPHHIARMRPLAYQKAVVMKYIQNLIAWGDQLFARDTLESINEATQLYVLAGHILGRKPRKVKPASQPEPKTYAELASLDATAHPLIQAESLVLVSEKQAVPASFNLAKEPPPSFDTSTFCVPPDDMLLALWDTVADRLFKIRHSMNLEGVVRELPLFEPPIDPALLVAARAAGVDLKSVLDDIGVSLSPYRFSFMHAKATELCSGLVSFGGALLSALEKKDGEGLSRLRQTQELDMLAAVKEVKKQQLKEAEQNLAGLQRALQSATAKYEYYATVPKVNPGELVALELSATATVLGFAAQNVSMGAASAKTIVTVTAGSAGFSASPVTVIQEGGQPIGSAMDSESGALNAYAGVLRDMASAAGTLGGYERRWEEYKFQQNLAAVEMKQVQKQIAAAEIRVAIAEKELENHDLQTEHARAVDEYLRGKFTNEELYDWMIGQLSGVYFLAYKLAYDVAKRAEKAYRFERAVESSSYITFGYWDGLKKGLLAGERLQHDLRRLEIAYLEQNKRELEITKHISLAAIAPDELMKLREFGTCTFELPEALFDFDYPGHYLRRIKSVSLTIPTVSGPYASVNCEVTLTKSKVRKNTDPSSTSDPPGQYRDKTSDTSADGRFARQYVPVTATIATSSAQNDSGMFEANLRDERYLPFEGAGVISSWELSVARATNAFDIATMSDVIMHVRYTARDGGKVFGDLARAEVVVPTPSWPPAWQPTWKRLISARTELPHAWAAFMSPVDPGEQTLVFQLDASMIPYLFGNGTPTVTGVSLYARWNGSSPYSDLDESKRLKVNVQVPGATELHEDLTFDPLTMSGDTEGDVKANTGHIEVPVDGPTLGTWTVSVDRSTLPDELCQKGEDGHPISPRRLDDTLQDVWLLVEYNRSVPGWA